MTIRPLAREDIPACAKILCAVYNNPIWQCRWREEDAAACLTDYFEAKRFIGFAALEDGCLRGAIFGHERIGWGNNEIFIDELFVWPEWQRRGVGTALLAAMEGHIAEKGLAGLTLTTNRHSPAPRFYEKNGFMSCEHVLFMARITGPEGENEGEVSPCAD